MAPQMIDKSAIGLSPASPGLESVEDLLAFEARSERPEPELCVRLAKALLAENDVRGAYRWLARLAESDGPYTAWTSAANVMTRCRQLEPPAARRRARVAIAGSHTTSQLGSLMCLAAHRRGIDLELYEAGYGLYAQELLDPDSDLYGFAPDYVLIAPHDGAIRFPMLSSEVDDELAHEAARWQALWSAVRRNSQARVIQHGIVIRPESAWGHVSWRVAGSRDAMLRALNERLAASADENVVWVDCDGIASNFGKSRWFDDRYWHLSKQAVALDALPSLARHTAAVLAAAEGLSGKCLVLDLDNTLWGGIIAEAGVGGIRLGDGPVGEAYTAFQEYVRALRGRGILLAVVSKNNDTDARSPFEQHFDMRLRADDFAVFLANWQDKATNLRTVASTLGIGLDALVFVDDNPAERQLVRQLLPEVEVIDLPADPAGYIRAVSDSLLLESASVTAEDLARPEQYRARAASASLESEASSLEEFYLGLGMEAVVAPFDNVNLARVVQLLAKTNQFNVTTRRHGTETVRRFMADDQTEAFWLRLRDRFGDHGLVALMIARQQADALDIDSWLMSCRVIGRTVEVALLARMCEAARARGCTRLLGTFIPTEKNKPAEDLFDRMGFVSAGVNADGHTTWVYNILEQGDPKNEFIRIADSFDA